MTSKNTGFTKRLLAWNNADNIRLMPWKGEKDPYRIWLSEIILQQTRVEQGCSYYQKFISAFPDVHRLARASEKKVFKLWEGLGYYQRCRNLILTAKIISREYQGRFPSNYGEILALKGIGPYTAAAIASFAFGLPYAVVDGNVQRVIARYFGIRAPVDTSEGKKLFSDLATRLLDKTKPGIYNQAIMDFGAVICRPKKPACGTCVQHGHCFAIQNNRVDNLPVKKKNIQKKNRWFYYLVIETAAQQIYIRQRKAKDIWRDLYEFVLWETDQPSDPRQFPFSRIDAQLSGKKQFKITEVSPVFKQQLTHQAIQCRFIRIQVNKSFRGLKEYQLVQSSKLGTFPFPRLITAYLQSSGQPAQYHQQRMETRN